MTRQNPTISAFIERWTGRGDEKQETQKFWFELLQAMGYSSPSDHLQFEKRVKLDDTTRFIDVYIPQTRVIVEQKSLGIDLSKAEQQSGGDQLTPYNQARRYDNNLPVGEKARWIVCCNFERFEIHDMEKPLAEPEVVLLKDMVKDAQKLSFLTDIKVQAVRREEEISFRAGRLVGELYDMILPQYADPENPDTLKSLNQLCVRLVFCLYAEDTGLFGEKDKFYKYLKEFNPGQFRKALIDLFKVFDTPYEARDKYMDPELASFPYIKGGIFTEDIEIPLFTQEIIDKLLVKASLEVDWSDISPTIFGAVFESTLNPQTRRSGGMHYTSVENIHKVIDPLFLDELREELDTILSIPVKGKRDRALSEYQDKLSGLKFLDPACGSGNFLTETYLSLRRLENKVLENLGVEGMLYFGEEYSPIKVKIDQFYGIEINDFAVSVARTALWIAESQTMKETEHIVGRPIEYFPLRENPNIVEGNALRIDWNDVVPKEALSYIMGNPPFVGTKMMDKEQKIDTANVLGTFKNYGTLDYVACWYKKAVDYTENSSVDFAFVSTNSLCQGEQVVNLWKPILSTGIKIIFAYRTFKWDSEANLMAHVHCVIVGLSRTSAVKFIVNESGRRQIASHINGYLVDATDVFIDNRRVPICDVEEMHNGCKFLDDGNYVMEQKEVEALTSTDPYLSDFIRPYYSAKNFINNERLFCIWLKGASPAQVRKSTVVMDRIERVRQFRQGCSSPDTRKYADRPMLPTRMAYYTDNQDTDMLVLPIVSSGRRKYLPVGYIDKGSIVSYANMIIPEASMYSFGVIESFPHSCWIRAVCGRMKSDFRYSNTIVYNNFPWPSPTEIQKERIDKTAQAILDARNLYPDCSLADLYDELTMPIELRKAHHANDRAVMEAYGFDPSMAEEQIVAELLKMYQKLVDKKY